MEREAQGRLTGAEEVLSAVDLAPVPTVAIDGDDAIVAVNDRFCTLTGFVPGELTGRHLREVVDLDPRGLADLVCVDRPSVPVEHRTRTLATPPGWRLVVLQPPTAPAEPSHDPVIVHGIAAMLVPVLLLRPIRESGRVVDLEVVVANEPAARAYLTTVDGLVGQRMAPTLETPEQHVFLARCLRASEGGRPFRAELDWHHRGRMWQRSEISVAPLADHLLLSFRDVTPEDHARLHLRSANAELERLATEQRRLVQAHRDFVSMASHELRTPVAVILGFADMLADPERLTDEARALAVDSIQRNARRQSRIVANLIDAVAAARGAVSVETGVIDVGPVIREALAEVPPARERARVICPDALHALADPERLTQILVSYLSNAVKYGGEGLWVRAETAADHVVIRVEDDGHGVPSEFEPELFEMFTQAGHPHRRTARGAGLGLHLARALAEAMDGGVFHERRRPSGATFGVRLPIPTAVTGPDISPAR